MDTLKAIEKLAQLSREEKSLQFDVADRVMFRIGALREQTISLLPFDIFGSITAVAAFVVAFFSVNAWQYIADPLIRLFDPLQEAPLW